MGFVLFQLVSRYFERHRIIERFQALVKPMNFPMTKLSMSLRPVIQRLGVAVSIVFSSVLLSPVLLGLTTQVAVAQESKSNDKQAMDKQVASKPISDKWALVIGISKFKDSSINLKFPAKDANDVYDYLIKEGRFAKDHVKLLTNENATRERILDELGDKWLPRVAMPDDLVMIYISTHGSPSDADVGGVNYLIAYDTDKDRLYSTGIAMQDLCRIIKARVHSDRTLILLDACHSGATTPDGKGLHRSANVDADSVAVGTGQLVICSSDPSQTSWEAREVPNSVFTRRLLEGFKLRGKDTTLGETFGYLQKKVQEDVLRDRGQMQTPILKSKWEGKDLIVGASPAEPRKGLEEPAIMASLPVAPERPIQRVSETPRDASSLSRLVRPTRNEQPAMIETRPNPTGRERNSSPVRVRSGSAVEMNRIVIPRPGSAQSRPENALAADAAIQAMREHFIRMSKHQVREAYADLSPGMQARTPMARYTNTVNRQNYLPSVNDLPRSAFFVRNSSPQLCAIVFDEDLMTGEPLSWTYIMVNNNGSWLINDVLPMLRRTP